MTQGQPTFYKKNEIRDLEKIVEMKSTKTTNDYYGKTEASEQTDEAIKIRQRRFRKLLDRDPRTKYTHSEITFTDGNPDGTDGAGGEKFRAILGGLAFHGVDPRGKSIFIKDTNVKNIYIKFYNEASFDTDNLFNEEMSFRIPAPIGSTLGVNNPPRYNRGHAYSYTQARISNAGAIGEIAIENDVYNFLNLNSDNAVLDVPDELTSTTRRETYDSFCLFWSETQDGEPAYFGEIAVAEKLWTPKFIGGGSSVVNTQPTSNLLSFVKTLQDGTTVNDKLNSSRRYNHNVSIQIVSYEEYQKAVELSDLSHREDFIYNPKPNNPYRLEGTKTFNFGRLTQHINPENPTQVTPQTVPNQPIEETTTVSETLTWEKEITIKDNHSYILDFKYEFPSEVSSPNFYTPNLGFIQYDANGDLVDNDIIIQMSEGLLNHVTISDGTGSTPRQTTGRVFCVLTGRNPYETPADSGGEGIFKFDPETKIVKISMFNAGAGRSMTQILEGNPVFDLNIYEVNERLSNFSGRFDHYNWVQSGDFEKYIGTTPRKIATLDLQLSRRPSLGDEL